jgi:hypothetical protein
VDNNNVVLGTIVTMSRASVVIVTSQGYLTTVNWSGTYPNAQIYYTSYVAGVCSGSAFLNGGNSGPTIYMYAKTLVWSGSLGTLMVASAAPVADGTVPSVTGSGIQGIDNPGCISSPSVQQMWALVATTPASVGLPATIVAPLRVQ